MVMRHFRHHGVIDGPTSPVLCCLHRGPGAYNAISVSILTTSVRGGYTVAGNSIGRIVRTLIRRVRNGLTGNSGIGLGRLNAFRVAFHYPNVRTSSGYAIHGVSGIGVHFVPSGRLGLIGNDATIAHDPTGINFILSGPRRNNSNNNGRNNNSKNNSNSSNSRNRGPLKWEEGSWKLIVGNW